MALNDYVFSSLLFSVFSLASEVLHSVLQCLNLMCFSAIPVPPQWPLFLFSFVAPDSHLRFWTLLVIANASCAVLSFGF